ncbi:MAG: hypothetical protein AAB332_05810 [Planctomycetota bacterium]
MILTGLPQASASTTMVGNPSRWLGRQRTSQALSHKGISSCLTGPVKRTLDSIPNVFS